MKSIENLIPHSGVMVLVDEIIEVTDEVICVKSTITENNAFLEDGVFPTFKTLEMMAQSLAVFRSYMDSQKGNKLGFLLGARKFEILKPYVQIGDSLLIKTKISMQDSSGLGVYDSQVYLGEEMIAQATISVLNPNDTLLEKILES